MISISDAARFSQENNITMKFKSWRETVLDYFILSLLILTIFSWAKVATADSSGLLCIPIDSNIGYSFNLAKYFNSRCSQVFENKVMLYYPYLLFIQWLLFSIVHKFWLKLPWVQTQFETFFEIFKELNIAQNSEENMDKTKKKFEMILKKKSFLVHLYTSKVILLLILTFSTECFLISWIGKTLTFFKADFSCHLDNHSPINDLVCNLQPSDYIYITIICYLVINLAILIMTCYNLHFISSRKWQRENHFQLFKIFKCYNDLCFCFYLYKTTTQRRKCILKAISKCTGTSHNYPFEETDSRDFGIMKAMCDELGLSIEKKIIGDGNKRKGESLIDIEKESFQGIEEIIQQTSDISKQIIILIHPYPTLEDVYKPEEIHSNEWCPKHINFVAYLHPSFLYTTRENKGNFAEFILAI